MCGNSFVDVLGSGHVVVGRVRLVRSTHGCLQRCGNPLLVNELPCDYAVVSASRVAALHRVR
jgi:hypothetical protein